MKLFRNHGCALCDIPFTSLPPFLVRFPKVGPPGRLPGGAPREYPLFIGSVLGGAVGDLTRIFPR